ncbi:MAG: phosphorylase [Rhodospirillales bacterium]|nr:phosphorylase [Rhodospirillales bacterium]
MGQNSASPPADGLWERVVRRAERALISGALSPIRTEEHVVDADRVRFVVRVVSSIRAKAREGLKDPKGGDPQEETTDPRDDPFLPYDPELFVADLSDTHVLLLNKFNVLDHHVLAVTRLYEDQEAPLTKADFAALARCLQAVDGLGFYNCGAAAGASQRHKHLQAVALPLTRVGPAIPVESLLAEARFDGRIGAVREFGFRHAIIRLEAPASSASALALEFHGAYRQLLSATGIGVEALDRADRRLPPYNLLATSSWMLLVPRSREHFGSVSINALAFAGSMFVSDAAQLQEIAAAGPMAVLGHVAVRED